MLGNKPLFDKLFPELKGILWCEVFMDAAFRERPYLDPKKPTDQAYLAPLYTYGGFKEDRSNIWSGFEPSDTMIHLGLDIQVKAGTQVASLTNGTILDILEDSAKFNGWGTKIIVETSLQQNNKPKKYYVLYGHLYKPSVKIGQEIKQGDILGLIAPPEFNGGWFEHLHLQVMDESLNVPIREVDGYEFKKNSITGVINPFEFYNMLYSK